MKITEITEGWGEYSNKSNHRMNKLKRNEEVDENWATGAMDAAGGMIKRQAADMKNTALAKMGSGKAQGAQQVQRVVGGIIKNFNTYLGQTGSKPTVAALRQYLTALGIQNPVLERRGQMPQKAQNLKNKLKTMPKPQKPRAQQPAQGPGTAGRKDTDILSRNDLFKIIGDNIQQAMASGALPKELKKFLGQ